MATKVVNWQIYKGTRYINTLSLRNKKTAKPINITNYKFYFTIKTSLNVVDGSATLQKSWTSHTSPTEGITTFELTESESNAISAGKYIYDFKWIDADGNAGQPFLSGSLEVLVPVTQAVS